MASSSCLTSLMLVMMMGIGVVQSGPRNIVRRQTVSDSEHINNNQLVGCFSNLALGKPCGTVESGDINDIDVPPTTERPGCRCVPNTQCNDVKITAPDADGGFLSLIDPRSSCSDPFEICCINVGIPPPPPGSNPQPPPKSYESKCGQLNRGGVKATMIGLPDNQAQFGQFPWMAAVMRTGDAGGQNVYLCGGSLVDRKVVMTTAHNIAGKGAHQLIVRLGEWNFKHATEPIIHQDIRVKSIIKHPDFAHSRLEYDIALLILESEPTLGPSVDLICLPNQFETYDGAECFSSGWGKDTFEDGKFQAILKSLKMPVVNHQQCQNAYRGTVLGNNYNLHKSVVCAGGNGDVDTCTGDGGSPLVCPKKTDSSSYVQVGLVSWGIGCGTDGVPGVYASVSEAAHWISLKIQEEHGINAKVSY